jgi:hypothetical protein
MTSLYFNKHKIINTYNDTIDWLARHNIHKYSINPDTLEIDVDNSVIITNYKFSGGQLPVKFGKISLSFHISHCNIKTMYGFPYHVGSIFNCNHNELTSLKYLPSFIGGSCEVRHNKLHTLNGCPTKVNGTFDCSYNKIITLKHCPSIIGYNFDCSKNMITDITNAPKRICNTFNMSYNPITSISTLHKYTKSIGSLEISNDTIHGCICVLLIKYINNISIPLHRRNDIDIINKHLQMDRNISKCQLELIDAGLEAYAYL